MSDLYTEAQIVALLRRVSGDNQAKWARENGVPAGFVNDVLHGRRPPGDGKLIEVLGLRKVVRYERV
jgi:hypothetical protein